MTTSVVPGRTPKLMVARKVAAYFAALTMLPYFLLKVFWVGDGLHGGGLHTGVWKTLDWVAVNAVTVAMSGSAIMLGLALGQRWGLRLPAWSLLLPAWVGMGFLCSMLPLIPVFAVLPDAGADPGGPKLPMATWEVGMISVSFAGFGLGLAVAVPLYVRERWPALFARRYAGQAGRSADTARAGGPDHARHLRLSLARAATAVCALLAVAQAYWAFGGTLGLDPHALAGRDLRWHLLTGSSGCWALVAAWGARSLGRHRGGPPSRVALLLTWVASGALFAWSSWRAAFVFAVPSAYSAPEYPAVQALGNHLGALAGLTILILLLLRVIEPVRAAGHGSGGSAEVPDPA
ncbi:hypothetical protein [Actinopolymorpha singaporensis]|uniref:Uncharacterized protein n=1 Tax=Actinopolymorpha singaporensis TaxID=117157 RepID=A0A1H1SJF7_9ACTN|nr:hypothetical protein [Actinopolymorpha singaporensis]SDS48180.1 hypothetical protein SAMN04489717_2832 [Actinopolymorpha singaporensis]